MALNEKYSYKDFTGVSLDSIGLSEINNSTVRGSCFYQETSLTASRRDEIERHVFPETMTGVVFDRCNLDNVYIPSGNTVLPSCSKRLIQVQNDLEDWILSDADLSPAEPVDKKSFQDLGISISPAQIPATPRSGESITQEKRRQAEQQVQLP